MAMCPEASAMLLDIYEIISNIYMISNSDSATTKENINVALTKFVRNLEPAKNCPKLVEVSDNMWHQGECVWVKLTYVGEDRGVAEPCLFTVNPLSMEDDLAKDLVETIYDEYLTKSHIYKCSIGALRSLIGTSLQIFPVEKWNGQNERFSFEISSSRTFEKSTSGITCWGETRTTTAVVHRLTNKGRGGELMSTLTVTTTHTHLYEEPLDYEKELFHDFQKELKVKVKKEWKMNAREVATVDAPRPVITGIRYDHREFIVTTNFISAEKTDGVFKLCVSSEFAHDGAEIFRMVHIIHV
eukprot:GHVS01001644.1.p1 GENE.GHVS01001644.1~~GHVS01001644.1.p1  ORF type:complete len:299 (+),score=20.04 GHVS01001644.1:157-1053(+)